MTEKTIGRGNFPATPFTFTYNAEEGVSRESTWKGRGRFSTELTLQIEYEMKAFGHSVTKDALDARNPRWAAERKRKEVLAAIRAAKRAERQRIADERAARKAARNARNARKAEENLQDSN